MTINALTNTGLLIGVSASLGSTPTAPHAVSTQAGYRVGGVPLTLARSTKSYREFWDAAASDEARRLDAELEILDTHFLQLELEEVSNENSILIVQPEELGHFTPTYGEPVKLRVTGFEQGSFQTLDVDEVDLEIFDI